jgi:hypothetical protein
MFSIDLVCTAWAWSVPINLGDLKMANALKALENTIVKVDILIGA